jgi:Tol biopolymer transport system component
MKSLLLAASASCLMAVGLSAIASEPRSNLVSPKHWTPLAVSTDGYEASPTFTPDGREMYYIGASKTFTDFRILVSQCGATGWSKGRPVSFAAPMPTIEADPFVTPDGKRLYFISARHDPGNEDFDIFYTDRMKNGSWGEPVRMPAPVNSPASELLPRVDASGRLYFGSARLGGLGQSDIYVAIERSPGKWEVDNVGPPVSTAANEYEAEVSRDGRSLVVVADRGDRSHLYRFHKDAAGWKEIGRVPARSDVFQVGPALSPKGERLLFAQAEGTRSGEIFVIDFKTGTREEWPPRCPR